VITASGARLAKWGWIKQLGPQEARLRGLAPRGLSSRDFKCIAENGFGDGLNSYAHSMAWFRDQLYVGTSRATLAMVQVNYSSPAMTPWPVKTPKNVYDLDRRAQIWRYDPRTGDWMQVFTSPMTAGRTGEWVARDIGYRSMAVFQGPNDSDSALYVCSWSSSKGEPPLILRSTDGSTFEEVPRPDWGDPTINTFRVLVPFKERLFTTPTGRTEGYGRAAECISDVPIVFETNDPKRGDWKQVSAPGFGDRNNLTIFEMATFNGFLYAGTLNPTSGFQIWKTRADASPPYRWRKVITDGAYRGSLNELAVSMCAFDNALYVGSGVVNGGYDRTRKIGPSAGEIIRIYPDDTWDLVVGSPRRTPQGFKFPLSARGPGFDNLRNGYIWRMAVHEGWLYVGTFNWSVLLPYLPLRKWPQRLQRFVEWIGIENLLQADGGFDLWRTWDGVHWTSVTRTGFGNPYNWGVRTMVSTFQGLFVGTANPFGHEVAARTAAGWTYGPNPRGGLEVWLGKRDREW
jgi:hypothetical protein